MIEQVDAVVVGMGPGGEDVAERLAEAGLDVVGIDAELVGGECPYWGCVPSKMMIRAADLLAEARRVDGMAGTAAVAPSWDPVATADPGRGDRRLGRHGGGRAVRGQGRSVRPGLGASRRRRPGRRRRRREFAARRAVVVGTGASPWAPPVAGLAGTPLLDQPRCGRDRRRCPSRLPCSGAVRSGWSWPRSSRGSARQVTVIEAAPDLVWPRGAGGGVVARRRVLPRRASRCGPRPQSSRSATTVDGSPSRSAGARWSVADGSWWRPDVGWTSARARASARLVSTRPPGRCRSTTTCGSRGPSASGRSAT